MKKEDEERQNRTALRVFAWIAAGLGLYLLAAEVVEWAAGWTPLEWAFWVLVALFLMWLISDKKR